MKAIKFVAVGSDEASKISKIDATVPSEVVLKLFSEDQGLSKEMEDKEIMCAFIKHNCLSGVAYNLYEYLYHHSDGSWQYMPRMICTQSCLDQLKKRGAVWAVYTD